MLSVECCLNSIYSAEVFVTVSFVCAYSSFLHSLHFALHHPLSCTHTCYQIKALRWPSGCRYWPTCILSFLFLSLSFYRNVRLNAVTSLQAAEKQNKTHFFGKYLKQLWNLGLSPAFRSCYFSHRLHIGFVFVCVSTFPEPCPFNQHKAHQEHGKISDEYEPQSTIN